jgi:Tol biopolymer transport system component
MALVARARYGMGFVVACLLAGGLIGLATVAPSTAKSTVIARSMPSLAPATSLPGMITVPNAPGVTVAELPDTAVTPAPSLTGSILFISRAVQPPPSSGPVTPGSAGYNLWVMAADGSGRRQLTVTSHDAEPALSPDGRAIAWVVGNSEVWVMRSDGTHTRRLHACPFGCQSPRWSPDGRTVAFVSVDASAEHKGSVVTIGADGTGAREFVTPEMNAYALDWSPDGLRLVVNVSWSDPALWVMAADTGAVTLIRHDVSIAPAWSPDGATILISDMTKLWAIAPDGTALRQVSQGPSGQYLGADWSPDGTSVVFDYFAQQPGVLQQIGMMNPDGGGERFLTDGTFEAYEATF